MYLLSTVISGPFIPLFIACHIALFFLWTTAILHIADYYRWRDQWHGRDTPCDSTSCQTAHVHHHYWRGQCRLCSNGVSGWRQQRTAFLHWRRGSQGHSAVCPIQGLPQCEYSFCFSGEISLCIGLNHKVPLQKLFRPWNCYVRTHFCTQILCTELHYWCWERLQVAVLWCPVVNITACNLTSRCWLTHLINTVGATGLHVAAQCFGSAPELCVGVGVGVLQTMWLPQQRERTHTMLPAASFTTNWNSFQVLSTFTTSLSNQCICHSDRVITASGT